MKRTIYLILALLPSSLVLAENTAYKVSTEWAEPGVVVIALDSLEAGSDERARAFSKFTGDDIDLDDIIPMQLEIAHTAANASGAIVVVPDAETKTRLVQDCKSFQLCDEIRTGRLRIEESAHDSVWIRDYGPQFGVDSKGEVVVLDARYYDLRQDEAKRDAQARLNIVRMNLIMRMIKHAGSDKATAALRSALEMRSKARSAKPGDESVTTADPTDDKSSSAIGNDIADNDAANLLSRLQSTASASTDDNSQGLTEHLALLSDLADVFDRLDISRAKDDASPAYIALAALDKANFHIERSSLYVDGGNLMHTSLGDCLTTKALIGRNHGIEEELTNTLKTTYGCAKVIYLEQLPGPVIEHVDMFALPGPGNRVLLGSYDLTDEATRAAWPDVPQVVRRLTVEAAVAMKRNERILRQEGYEVISVPSPLPRMDGEDIYYPTLLNALAFKGSDESLNVLVPTYEGVSAGVQKHALELISNTFGPGAHIVPIEATVAAARQGAVHCLTIVVPLRLTQFADQAQSNLRATILAAADKLDEGAAELAQARNIDGVWHVEQAEGNDSDVHEDERYVFKDDEFQHKRGLESDDYAFMVISKTSRKWSLLVGGGPGDNVKFSEGSIEWIDANHLRLIYGTDRTVRNLVRS